MNLKVNDYVIRKDFGEEILRIRKVSSDRTCDLVDRMNQECGEYPQDELILLPKDVELVETILDDMIVWKVKK